jgi:hypothetical protein
MFADSRSPLRFVLALGCDFGNLLLTPARPKPINNIRLRLQPLGLVCRFPRLLSGAIIESQSADNS